MYARIAIVTGASSGIGKAIYEELKKDDFSRVIGVSRRGPDIYADITEDPEHLQSKILDELDLKSSRVSLLVNNAGIMPFDVAQDRRVFDVNFWGAYNMINILADVFAYGACVINIASISGVIHEEELPIYSASKAALISLTKSLAKRYAPSVRVNCISPGLFFPTDLVPGEEQPPQWLIDKIPMGKFGNPESLAEIVEMIYSNTYMTGANIIVDGGASC